MCSVFTCFKKDSVYRYIKLCIFVLTLRTFVMQGLGVFLASPGPAGFLASRRALLSPKLQSFTAVRALDVSKNCWICRKSAEGFVYQKKVEAKMPQISMFLPCVCCDFTFSSGSLLRHVVMIPVSYGWCQMEAWCDGSVKTIHRPSDSARMRHVSTNFGVLDIYIYICIYIYIWPSLGWIGGGGGWAYIYICAYRSVVGSI